MISKPEDVRVPFDDHWGGAKSLSSKLSPNYYKRWKIEPLTFCMENDLPFWLGSVLKYCMRYDQKDGLQDLYKAQEYLNRKIAEMEGR